MFALARVVCCCIVFILRRACTVYVCSVIGDDFVAFSPFLTVLLLCSTGFLNERPMSYPHVFRIWSLSSYSILHLMVSFHLIIDFWYSSKCLFQDRASNGHSGEVWKKRYSQWFVANIEFCNRRLENSNFAMITKYSVWIKCHIQTVNTDKMPLTKCHILR